MNRDKQPADQPGFWEDETLLDSNSVTAHGEPESVRSHSATATPVPVLEPTAVIGPPRAVPQRLFTRDLIVRRVDGTLDVLDHDEVMHEPVQRLNEAMTEVLDYEAYPDRGPEETIALINDAMTAFIDDTAIWSEQAAG